MRFSSSTALVALLASVDAAKSRRARPALQARDAQGHQGNPGGVSWVTQYDYVTQVIPVTTTVWVSSGFVPPTPGANAEVAEFNKRPDTDGSGQAPPPPASPTSSPIVLATPQLPPNPPAATPTPVPAPAPPAAPAAGVSSAAAVPPAPVVNAVVAPQAPTTLATSAVAAPVPSAAAAAVVPVSSASAPLAAASAPAVAGSSGSSSMPCTTSSCSGAGRATQWDANGGTGSCGTVVQNGDAAVAMSHLIMAPLNPSNPNLNPLCGKQLLITDTKTGNTRTVTIRDTCPGCDLTMIDVAMDFLFDFGGKEAVVAKGWMENLKWEML